ncbi:MAG: UDP-N-acetylmuramoyl-L-alanine--D-glutamate ligase [Pseudomonadota bacterium]
MIAVRGYEGRRVGVLGLGRSGIAAADALRGGSAMPVLWDDNEAERARAVEAGFTVEDLTKQQQWADMPLLVVSPGVPHLYPAPHPAITAAQQSGALVDNDVSLFFRALAMTAADVRVICVTGSNGKSTTTALIGHILADAGRPHQIGGNIGRGVLDLDPPADGETIILELSSYQLELARALAPDIAVFLNLSPDHLDRHGGEGGYFAAKRRLFELGAPTHMVIGVDDPHGAFLATATQDASEDGATLIRVSAAQRLKGEARSVFMNKNHLTEWKGKQVAAFDMRTAPHLQGNHNAQNTCAAWATTRALGIGPKVIGRALTTFPGLPHRMEIIGQRGGVTFVNDSKATNADAAEKALSTFESIRWIAGGVAKSGGIASLEPLFYRIAKTYLIGEAADEFAFTLGDQPFEVCRDLDAALARAAEDAVEGDVVLLSPACASFDQFASFEARGDQFRAAAQRIIEGAP